MDAIWQLVVGFLLTTVLGGLLGTYLQERGWRHQNDARLQEAELRLAEAVCEAVSGLLDKRRYRMQRLFHAVRVQGRGQETVPADGLAASLDDYDRVAGRMAKIVVREPVDGQVHFEGRVTGIEDGAVLLAVGRTKVVRLPFERIARGRLAVEF